MIPRSSALGRLGLLVPLALSAACASVSMNGYGDGWVKTSPVSYSFDGPPLLQPGQAGSYHVRVDGLAVDGPQHVGAFDRNGMTWSDDPRHADVTLHVELGEVHQGEPGAMKLGGKWYPAFEVSVPYEIEVEREGRALDKQTGRYSNALTFKQMPGFASREEAVGAIDVVRKLGQSGIEDQARAGAWSEAQKSADGLGDSLFRERTISMTVPVVRAAAGLDLEEAYAMLVEAKSPEQVRAALAAYEALGTDQRKEDGTENRTANYGVACGMAACKLLLRDLAGAWETCQLAATFEPEGDEVDQIRYVIYEQERITGVRVLPEEERARIDSARNTAAALENLFGSLGAD